MEHANNNETLKTTFKKRFDELRGGLSNTELAKKIGLSRQTVGFFLNGDRLPSAENLVDIAKKCNVSVDYLLGLSDCPAMEDKAKASCEYTGLSLGALEALKKAQDMVAKYNSKCNIDTNCLENLVCCLEQFLPELLSQETECARINMFLEVLNDKDDPTIQNNPDFLKRAYHALLNERLGIAGLKYEASEAFSRLYNLITPYTVTKKMIEATLERIEIAKEPQNNNEEG